MQSVEGVGIGWGLLGQFLLLNWLHLVSLWFTWAHLHALQFHWVHLGLLWFPLILFG